MPRRRQTVVQSDVLLVLRGHTAEVTAVTFSPDGALLASISRDQTVRTWNANTGEALAVIDVRIAPYVNVGANSVAFSSNGLVVAALGSNDDTVRTWDAITGMALMALEGHTKSVTSVAFSPDGSAIASGSADLTTRLWDAKSGAELHVLKGHTDFVRSVAFSPNSAVLATASWDNTAQWWNAKSGEALMVTLKHPWPVTSVAFSPNGLAIASGSQDNSVRLWDATTGAVLKVMEGKGSSMCSVAFSSDGAVIAHITKRLSTWDVIKGTLVKTAEQIKDADGWDVRYECAAFSPRDTGLLVAGLWNGSVCLLNLRTRRNARREMFTFLLAALPRNKSSASHAFLLHDASRDMCRHVYFFLLPRRR